MPLLNKKSKLNTSEQGRVLHTLDTKLNDIRKALELVPGEHKESILFKTSIYGNPWLVSDYIIGIDLVNNLSFELSNNYTVLYKVEVRVPKGLKIKHQRSASKRKGKAKNTIGLYLHLVALPISQDVMEKQINIRKYIDNGYLIVEPKDI